ncbi:hypothetical protein ASC65_13160 [Brevundimonas sp. Root1279]|nr:hypothetical protein ASC65_13160 [Brevundimonas sp. Root1279]
MALLLPLAVLPSGCMTLAAVQRAQEENTATRLAPFNAAEHAWALGPGATVTGTVMIDTMWTESSYGRPSTTVRKVLTCAGRIVRLIPDTPHMRWTLDVHYMLPVTNDGYWSDSTLIASPSWTWPEESRAVVREGVCDASGGFRFEGVPDGAYLVMALVEGPESYMRSTDVVVKPVEVRAVGGAAHAEVRLKDNWLTGSVVRH